MSRFFAMEERELEKIISLHNDLEKIKAEASRKEIHEITAIIKSEIVNMGDLFEIKDGIANIPIIGQLSESPAISASLFGFDQTTFGSIIDNINKAENDPTVNKIVFHVDSGGGTVSGTDQTSMRVKAIKLPTEAHVHNMAASAALWTIINVNKIIAMTPTAEIGSIGVAAEVLDDSERDKQRGIKIHTIVSSGAEEKHIDVSNKSGRDKIKSRLNEIHNIFVSRIAEGRGVSEETVREDFGKGGVLIASEALRVGMIDGIMDGDKMILARKDKKKTKATAEEMKDAIEILTESKIVTATEPAEGAGKNIKEVISMTKEEFKTQNPDLYTQVLEEGEQAGIKKERDRVRAHLTMGKASGAIETAVKYIEEGEDMTQAVNAEYMAAGMNKNDIDSRKGEEDKLGNLNNSSGEDGGNAAFAQALDEELGYTQEAV